MCLDKKEVEEIVASGNKTIIQSQGYILESIKKIENKLGELPCGASSDRLLKLEFKLEELEKDRAKEAISFEKIKETLFSLTRSNGGNIKILLERSNNQKEWSTKTWAIIIAITTITINAIFRIM